MPAVVAAADQRGERLRGWGRMPHAEGRVCVVSGTQRHARRSASATPGPGQRRRGTPGTAAGHPGEVAGSARGWVGGRARACYTRRNGRRHVPARPAPRHGAGTTRAGAPAVQAPPFPTPRQLSAHHTPLAKSQKPCRSRLLRWARGAGWRRRGPARRGSGCASGPRCPGTDSACCCVCVGRAARAGEQVRELKRVHKWGEAMPPQTPQTGETPQRSSRGRGGGGGAALLAAVSARQNAARTRVPFHDAFDDGVAVRSEVGFDCRPLENRCDRLVHQDLVLRHGGVGTATRSGPTRHPRGVQGARAPNVCAHQSTAKHKHTATHARATPTLAGWGEPAGFRGSGAQLSDVRRATCAGTLAATHPTPPTPTHTHIHTHARATTTTGWCGRDLGRGGVLGTYRSRSQASNRLSVLTSSFARSPTMSGSPGSAPLASVSAPGSLWLPSSGPDASAGAPAPAVLGFGGGVACAMAAKASTI